MYVEEDGDEVFTKIDLCYRCRIGFDHKGRAVYSKIVASDGWWKCENCDGSYGEAKGVRSGTRPLNVESI